MCVWEGGPPTPQLNQVEYLTLDSNKGRPVVEDIQGGQPLTLSLWQKLSPPYKYIIPVLLHMV